MKKKTIACDKCGARIDHIPKHCPVCGEEIYDRMDPHIRMRIEEKMRPSFFYHKLLIYLLVFPIAYAAVGLEVRFNEPDFLLWTLCFLLLVIGIVYALGLVSLFDKPFTWHLVVHLFVFEGAVIAGVFSTKYDKSTNQLYCDYFLTLIILVSVFLIVFIGGLFLNLYQSGVFERRPKIKYVLLTAAALVFVLGVITPRTAWYGVQRLRLSYGDEDSRYWIVRVWEQAKFQDWDNWYEWRHLLD